MAMMARSVERGLENVVGHFIIVLLLLVWTSR